MTRRLMILLAVVLLGAVMANCGPSGGSVAQPSYEVIERGNYQGRVFTKELPISNCGSDQDLKTEQRVDQKYTHDVEILLVAGSDEDPAKLANVVREHYKVDSISEVANYTVVANVPPDRIMTYIIEWTENWRNGDVKVDEEVGATYKFLESITGGVTDIKTSICP